MKSCFDAIIKPKSLENLLIRYDSIRNNLRIISPEDENLQLIPILIIQFKGTGSSRTLTDIKVSTADIGSVSEKYADIAVHSKGGKTTPYHIDRRFAQYMIICKNVNQTKENFETL